MRKLAGNAVVGEEHPVLGLHLQASDVGGEKQN